MTISTPRMAMGMKATGFRTEFPSQAYVPFSEKRMPANVAKKTGKESRRARKYVDTPAITSRAM